MKRRRFSNPSDPTWLTCSVPDCENKRMHDGTSDRCFPHTYGLTPVPMEEYQRTGRPWKEDISQKDAEKLPRVK
jgi:hypothetical protein